MNYIYINSNLTSYSSNERSLYGELYLELDTCKFPEDGWDDIISSVLDMWIENIHSLLRNNFSDVKDFCFMDGPYYFSVSNSSEDIANVTLYENRRALNDKPYQITYYNLISEICNIINAILNVDKYREIKTIDEIRTKYLLVKKLARAKGYKL